MGVVLLGGSDTLEAFRHRSPYTTLVAARLRERAARGGSATVMHAVQIARHSGRANRALAPPATCIRAYTGPRRCQAAPSSRRSVALAASYPDLVRPGPPATLGRAAP